MTRPVTALLIALTLGLIAATAVPTPLQAQLSPLTQAVQGGGDGGGDSGAGQSGEQGQSPGQGQGQGQSPGEGQAGALAPDTARALAEALNDPQARQALIDELLRAAGTAAGTTGGTTGGAADGATDGATDGPAADGSGSGTGSGTGSGAPGAGAGEPSLARQVAEATKGVAEEALRLGRRLTGAVTALTDLASGKRPVNWARLGDTLVSLAIVAGATLLAWWIVGRVAQRVFAAMANRAADRGWLRRTLLLLGTGLVDALVILAAWGGGYALALSIGDGGAVDINQSLFLNAFLLIETSKVVLRLLLAPRHGALRLLPLGDETANYWYFWAARLVGLLGYGFMLVVPVANATLSWTVGRSLQLLIALAATLIAIAVILQNRARVRAGLRARAARLPGEVTGRLLGTLARIWHLLALGYVLALFVIWLARPFDALSFMLRSTLESLAAVAVGVIIVSLLTRTISGGMRLPDEVKRKLPLLEGRLNAFVPNILKVVRVLVLIGVLIAIGEAWEVLAFFDWLASELGREIVARLVGATLILLVSVALWMAVSSWIEYRLNPEVGRAPTARLRTLLSLFRNAFTITLLVVAVMLALSELGVNIGPLLAGAGVVGLAIGFGAQKLVQDIITGAFIQFENALNEGDVVTLAGVSGVVEKLTVRSVALRDLSGVYHLIPFSSVDSVSNFMKGFGYHLAEIGVAYREDIAEVKQVMQEAFEELTESEHGPSILEPLEMHGVTQFGDSAVVVRARIKCRPGDQWAVGRAYNEIIKRRFDAAGIEIPFPHVTLYMGEGKDGAAPPLHLQSEEAAKLVETRKASEQAPPAAAESAERTPSQDGPDAAEPSEESKQDGPG